MIACLPASCCAVLLASFSDHVQSRILFPPSFNTVILSHCFRSHATSTSFPLALCSFSPFLTQSTNSRKPPTHSLRHLIDLLTCVPVHLLHIDSVRVPFQPCVFHLSLIRSFFPQRDHVVYIFPVCGLCSVCYLSLLHSPHWMHVPFITLAFIL